MKKILFLVGPHASGKTYSTNIYLSKHEGIDMIDTGPIMRSLHKNDAPDITFGEWVNELEKKYGKDITSNLISKEIEKAMTKSFNENFVIVGFRSIEGIQYAINYLGITDYNILYIDASRELLYKNFITRTKKDLSYEDFNIYLDNELDSGLGKLKTLADLGKIDYFYKLANEDDFSSKLSDCFGQKLDIDYIWPIEPEYKLIEHDMYGIRPIHMILKRPRFHSGFDIAAKTMTPVKCSKSGIVVSAGLDEKIVSGSAKWNERYGNKVEILDASGKRLVYAHLREVLVNVGQEIKQSDIIGLSGCSGGARIPHLHFEVRKIDTCHSGEENTIDPLKILPKRDLLSLEKHFDEQPYAKIWELFLEKSWGVTDDDIPYAKCKSLIR